MADDQNETEASAAEEFQPEAPQVATSTAPKKEAPDLSGTATPAAPADPNEERLQALHAVPVDLQVVLGHASLPVAQLLKLSRGAVVEIDRKVGECVDIHINSHLVARGEVVILDDNKLGITLTDIASAQTLAAMPGRVA